MLNSVKVGTQPIGPYRPLAGDVICDEAERLARDLQGVRILHINATPYGGGVAEILRSEIPLLRGLGLDAEWHVISGDTPFFEVTKGLHNALQGGDYSLTDASEGTYLLTNVRNARLLDGQFDVIVVHDPQPAALRALHGGDHARWIWRCHIDTSQPNEDVATFIEPFLEPYDAVMFTTPDFVLPSLRDRDVHVVAPAIDPLSPKNLDLPIRISHRILNWHGVDVERPLVTQVSRFDRWKDPLGVLGVYREVRREVPDLQLALIGSSASDDPEGRRFYEQVMSAADGDPDINVISDLSDLEVAAFRCCSKVAIQKSKREGFGLVISESLWRGIPVVAGRTGGIPLQMPDGAGGFLADPEDQDLFADRVLYLLTHPDEAGQLGEAGREVVREHFLLPRLIVDELRLMRDFAGAKATAA